MVSGRFVHILFIQDRKSIGFQQFTPLLLHFLQNIQYNVVVATTIAADFVTEGVLPYGHQLAAAHPERRSHPHSDTSIIRLCRTLGYRGFRELQESQRAELAQVMESGRYVIPRQQVEGKLEQYQNCSPFQCLQLAMETLQETYRKNRPEKFERAAQLLLQSEHIFISGFRGFSGSARYMGVLLSQYINRVTYYCDADTRCVEGLIDYGSQDCVVVFGAERYSRMSCVLAQIARDAHCRLIVITDKLTAPLAVGADIVLLADFTSPTAVNSYLGVNFLVEAIAFEVSRQLGVFPQQRLSRMDHYLSELHLY